MKGAYMFLADGFEETEALAPVDVLRRGGIDAKLVSIYPDRKTVTGSHNIPITADLDYAEFADSLAAEGTEKEDIMIFPGGMPGSSNLAEDEDLMDLMLEHYADGGSVAAICAAPSLVLSKLPDLNGMKMTCYEGFQKNLTDEGADFKRDAVVIDGNVITGRGPGLAIIFGLGILSHLKGREAAEQVARGMML